MSETEKRDRLRELFAADDRFADVLRAKHGDAAGEIRYAPSRWDDALRAAWAEVERAREAWEEARGK